jgi:hypothetical protein
MKRLQKHLGQAEKNTIKQVRFIRKIVTENWMKESQEYEDENKKYIFKVYTTKGDNYFVNLAQIHDIIGNEPWFNGETNIIHRVVPRIVCGVSGNFEFVCISIDKTVPPNGKDK